MKRPLSPREIQRWYPKRWFEIAGNTQLIQVWWHFLTNGACNLLVTGPSRTCKTRLITLGIKALLCLNRGSDQNPCYRCSPCKHLGETCDSVIGTFQSLWLAEYSYYPIDCSKVTLEELKELPDKIDLRSLKSIVYLDEVAELRRRGLEAQLLKLSDESNAVWIASAISIRNRISRGRKKLGLSAPMQGRFGTKIGTTNPSADELSQWIRNRCKEWCIEIIEPDRTIPIVMKRTRHRVGYVLHFLADAASRGWELTPEGATTFNLSPVD